MASASSGDAPIQLARSNTALDPVGVCLALDGRLSSAESREALAGALRQASDDARCHSSGVVGAAAASGEQLPPGASSCGAVGAGAPRCLSSQAHQLSGDRLTAFAASAPVPAPPSAADDDDAGEDDRCNGACDCTDGCSCTGAGSAAAAAALRQQHSLLEGPASPPQVRSGGGGGQLSTSSSSSGGAGQARPLVTAAIERTSTATLDANGGVDHGVGAHDPSCTCPPYAVKSTCGKRPNMEDTYALCPNICELPMTPMSGEHADKLPHRIAVQFETHAQEFPRGARSAGGAATQSEAGATEQQQPSSGSKEQQQQQQPSPVLQQQQDAAEATAAAFAAPLPAGPLADGGPDGEHSMGSVSSSDGGGGVSIEKLHFFGVYDGHGGIEASQHCAQRLHYHLSTAVAQMANSWLASSLGGEGGAAGPWNPDVRYSPLETARVDGSSPGECFLTSSLSTDEAAAVAAAVAAASEPQQAESSPASSGSAPCSSSSVSSTSSMGAPTAAGRAAPGSAAAGAPDAAAAAGSAPQQQPPQQQRDFGRSISAGSGGSNDEVDSNEGSSGDGADATGAASFSGMMEQVLRNAFLKTDEEFSDSGLQAGLVGSTAVVALVGTHRVWLANCGDSRAVLSRGGKAVQVTDDHKPEREDEAERVEKAGGQVLYWNGHRVMGVLAMSRAIGDHCLRPYVIPEPEISVFARHARDELLLLATDGLWDVLSNQEATDLALRSIKRAREKGASRKAAARVAATVLTKAAVDRGSRDNITVVIIDLAPPPTPAERAAAAERASAAAAAQQAAAAAAAGGCAPGGLTQQIAPQQQQEGDAAAAAAGGTQPPASRQPSSGGGHRRQGSGSNCGSRQGSMKPARSCSGGASNPFAAAAASPFSTAATGSSELPLPTSTAVLGGAPDPAAASAGTDRTTRSSAGGASTSSGVCHASGSAFAAAPIPASVSTELSACASGSSAGMSRLVSELDSIDLSGAHALRASGGAGSRSSSAHGAAAASASMAAMVGAGSAAGSSTASSQLEEQPTLVDPPPPGAAGQQPATPAAAAATELNRQPSSSPFSACQDGPGFSGDADA